ncbi:MAG TPA: Calx-beta domain-containing protein, partial [Pyrinomonadaceae bacterium]|nr:Calx-beta domain-containing protein [Pyrinomonadaceae bacterium]
RYTVTDLGTLDGSDSSTAFGLNSSGQVVGSTKASGKEDSIRAFLYSRGLMKNLGTLGGIRSEAAAINNDGHVVGTSNTASQRRNAFLYRDGVMSSLGTLPEDDGSYAFDINNSGRVVGASYKVVVLNPFPTFAYNFERAYLYSGGVMQDLSALLGGAHSRASGINEAGDVVGRFAFRENSRDCPHPFLYSGGKMTDLGEISGFPCSEAVDVNDSGEVVGASRTQDSRNARLFLYRDGVMYDLGDLGDQGSHPFDINNAGQIVGTNVPRGKPVFAFLYEKGILLDLNSLIAADSGWTLASATDTNEAGQIVGWGIHNGESRAFLLTPATAGSLQFDAHAYSVGEGQPTATITVTRTSGTSGEVSATITTGGGTASAGEDYTAVSQVVTFAEGESGSKTVAIPIKDDALVEGNETVTLTLGSPTAGAILGNPATAVLTIADNDACSYSISPSNHNAIPKGQIFTVNITAQSGCAWTAVSNSNFINVTAGASGNGNGAVTLIILSNGTGVPRTGTVTIAGQTFTVTQSEVIPDVLTLGFTQPNYVFNEGDGRATLTIRRMGDIFGAASADYRTTDTDTFTVGCADNANNGNGAYGRCDFATTVGRIEFAPGESQKTLTIPIIDDGHDEQPETFQVVLSNLTGASSTSANLTTTVTIQDNDAAGAPNPVTASLPFFVRQQYLDFLSREPDQGGFDAWLGVLGGCANPNTGPNVPSLCDRIYVSGEGFFRSQEFRLKGGYVFRFYRLAFNRLPEYPEIVSDMSFVAGQMAEEVYARKAQLATLITERAEFQTLYAGMNNEQFVNALLARYQLAQVTTPDPGQPDTGAKVTLTGVELTSRLAAGTMTRAQVLRAVADSDEVGAREFNNAFVGMQYYGYLRRKPDEAGFRAWLGVLQAGNVRTMVDGFLNSTEYRLRFGQP